MSTHRRRSGLLLKLGAALFALSALLASALFSQTDNAHARPPVDESPGQAKGIGNGNGPKGDNFKSPLAEKQDRLKQKALEKVLKGEVIPQGKNGLVQLGKGQYVELAQEGSDRIFVVLAEFGDEDHEDYPVIPAANAQLFDGPLHNEIPEPDRATDNSTLWQEDFSTGHYQDMYFNRMAEYYQSQSSGRYSVEGDVVEWVKVPFNERRYGSNDCDLDGIIEIGVDDDIVCPNVWFLLRDAMAFWVQDQLDSGKTIPEIRDYLKTFDIQDRYDLDGDGKFDEPDGMIDHFQIVHAGGDEAARDPLYGQDAIWSHRWQAQISDEDGCPLDEFGVRSLNIGVGGTDSGVDIPDNPTGICIFDYTIQPENGGLGVFAHEFAHDLGLPDLYDTSGNTGGAENSTAFWTLMSSGANIGDGGPDGIGDDPTDMGVWEKFQLGWLGFPGAPGGTFYQVAFAGQSSGHKLGPAEQANKQGQALFVVLPDKARLDQVTDPADGDFFYYSGMGDDMTTTMTKDFNLPAGASLTADAWFRMESGYDFAFLEVSTDGGTTFTPVETNLSTDTDLSGINGSGAGITGSSGPDWIELTADLSAYTGAVKLRFRYSTDPAVTRLGFAIDNLEVSGSELDGAEEAAAGWTFDGFKRTTGSETSFHFNAYVAENRRYVGYDKSLATAYNFGFLPDQPQKVEFYPYQDGLLLSYWDESFSDNSVGDHPGGGLILPIDMHPSFHHDASGGLLRGRILSYDSTLTLTPTDAISLHILGQPVSIGSQPAVSVFNDLNDYWFDCDEHDGQEVCTGDHPGRYQPGWTSVNVPKTGTTIRLASIDAKGFMTVLVNK